MPDIGGVSRGLLKGALSATEKAAEKVKDAREAVSRKTTDDDPEITQVIENPADPDATQVISDPDATQVIRGSVIATAAQPAGPGQRPPALVSAGAPPRPVPAPGGPVPHAPAGPAPSGEPTLADEPEDHADESDVRELVAMFRQLLGRRRPPAGPIQGEWAIGIGDLLAEHPRVPQRVRGLVGRLNRFGGVSYSPRGVGFDGDDVPWEKVTEVRTRHVVDYLVGDAVQQQVENLPVPWFPGRRRLLDALGQAILTVTIATARDQLDKLELGPRVPAEIACKASFGRTKELNAGVLSAIVLADPAVNQSLIATARARGITVTAGDDEAVATADERAERIRAKVAALEAELERFGRSG
jgi:hypothetical protein